MKLHHICAYGSVFAWVASAIAVWMIHKSPYLPPELIMAELCNDNGDCTVNVDVIRLASQMGRLDFVAISLAILGVGLGVGAISGYLAVRERSGIIAKDVARETAEKWMKKQGRELVLKETQLIRDLLLEEVGMKDGDAIAGMVDDDDNNGGDANG